MLSTSVSYARQLHASQSQTATQRLQLMKYLKWLVGMLVRVLQAAAVLPQLPGRTEVLLPSHEGRVARDDECGMDSCRPSQGRA